MLPQCMHEAHVSQPASHAPGGQGRRHPWGRVEQRWRRLQAGLIGKEDIIIDAKSGVSGAGRSAKQNLLYTEIAEGLNCYGVTRHRHMPEIEQVLYATQCSAAQVLHKCCTCAVAAAGWLPAARSGFVSWPGPLYCVPGVRPATALLVPQA